MTKHWKQVRVHKHLLANEFYLLKRQTKDGLKTLFKVALLYSILSTL